MRFEESKSGARTTSSSPPCPLLSTLGTPVIGSPALPSREITYIRPSLAVARRRPSGRKRIAQVRGNCSANTDVVVRGISAGCGARVCPAKAGFWWGALGGCVSTGSPATPSFVPFAGGVPPASLPGHEPPPDCARMGRAKREDRMVPTNRGMAARLGRSFPDT